MKATKEIDETNDRKGQMMVLASDKKSKEERAKCKEQHRSEREGITGNIGLRFRNNFFEIRASKDVKNNYSSRNLEEYMQNKCRK